MSWIDDRIKERENRSQNAKNSQNGKKGKTQSAQNGQAGSGASSWVDQRLNERQQQERARQEKALQQEREWMLQQKKLEASQRTSKRSQVMLQGFHKDPLKQAASEAELAVKQYQREQPIYQTMMKNAGSSEARQRQTIEQANAGFNAVTGKMKRYNESVNNAEAQQRKDYEHRLQELKKTNRGAYYGETLNREQIEGQLRMLEREKAELEPQVLEAENGWGGPGQTIIGGKYTDQELLYKGRSKRLQEIEDEITAYKAALNYSKQSGYEATARRLLDEQQNDTETFRKKASSGKQKFYEDQKAAKTTAETSLSKYDVDSDKGIGYTPSAKAQAFDESGYVDDLDSDYVRSWQKNVFYALYDEDPEKAKEWLRLAKENTENEYYSRLAEFAGQNAFTRTGAFLGGTALRTMSGVANLVDPFSDTALELNRGGQALISGGAQGLQEKGVFNTGFLSGTMDERIPVLSQLFGDKGLGDLYQLASSMLESGANAYVAAQTGDLSGLVGALGTIIMGSSASVADYEEGLKRGLTRAQAMQHALASGINEAAFEYLSLDKMVNPDASASLLKKVLQQGGVEASEEFCTTIANRLADGYLSYKNGYDSQIKSRADELVAQGMGRYEANEKAEMEWTTELINDAIGGFLSGGGNMALNAAADYAASKVSDMTQKLKLLTKGQNTKKLEAVSEIDPEQNKSLSIEREISEPDNNRNQIKRIREESVQAALNEGKNMDFRQLRQMIDSYRAMLDENTDNAEFEAAAQGQIQGLEEILNQRRIEAGDDLGLAEGLGRVGVKENAAGEDVAHTVRRYGNEDPVVAHDVRRYGENGGLAAPGSEDIEGGLNDGGNQQLTERAGEDAADGGQWDAGMGTEGQAGGLGEGTGRSVGGSQAKTEQARLRAQIRSLETERRSAKQIGVFGGTNNQNLHVVPAELYTGEMQEIQRKAEDNGQRVTFVAGGALELRRKGGSLQKANAIYQINRDGSSEFFIRADMNRYTPGQLYAHEEFHDIAATNRGMFLDMVEDLFAHHSEEEISRMIDAYVEAMDGCYGVYEEGMSEDAQAELRNKYLEEILADQYAGMNRGGQKAQAARETAGETAQRFAGDIENARQNRAGIDRRNGPGVRFSFSEEEADAMREEGIYVSPGPSALNKSKDNKSVSFVLAKNISMLEDMEPVAHLSGKELNDRTIDLPVQIKNWFDSFGNAETRDGLGTVLFDEYGVGGIMNHKPLNRAKVVTVMATRDVVKYGKQLSYETNWKGRGYDSIIYGAPVTVGSENTKLYVAAVVDIIQENKFYMNECVDSDGNYVRINEGPPSSTKTGFTVQDGVTRGPGEPSIHSIAQVSEESNTSEKNNPDAVDWEGNRELKQSISEDDDGIDLSRYSGRDRVYMEAVKNGNTDEAAWMVEDAAKRAGFTHKGFHQTGADFTSFSTKNEVAGQFDDETPTGIFIKPTDEDIGLQSGTKQMPLYFKADNMLEFANREEIRKYWIENVQGYRELDAQLQARNRELEQQYDELDAEWDRVYQETYDSDDQSALDDVDRRQDEFLERWNRDLQPLRRQMKNLVTEYMKGTDYDGIHLKYDGKVYGGPRVETYIVFNPEQTKSAEPIVRDDNGNVIPLSERFRTDRSGEEAWKNRDIRFSPVEADEEAADWNGNREEMDSSDLRADEGIAPYDAQNDYKENSGQIDRAAEEDKERPMNASPEPETGEGGRSMSAPTEQGYAEQAREKKTALAERTSVDGLKNRIQSAEERLKMWKTMQASGFVAKDARTQAELKQRISDVEETLKIDREVLAKKQEARKAELTDKAKRKKKASERKAEEKALKKKAELEADKPRQARKEFRQDALNLFSVPAGKRAQLGDILNRFSDKLLAQKYVSQEDRRALFTQLLEAGVEVVPADEYHQQIRSFVDEGRIYVPESVRSEFGDDWAAFRQRAWGNGIYLTNDHNDRGADAWNVELAEMFPGSFDETDTDARSVLENIVELAEEGKSEFLTIGEMMQRNRDQTGQSVDEQMDELEKKVDKLIDTFAQKAELEKKVRTEGAMKLAKERAKNREIAERQAQRQRDNQKREEVMKQLQQLSKMRKKSAPEIRAKIDEIIGNLDTMARSITPAGLENLQDLARRYAEAKEDPNFLGNPYVEQRLARLSQVQLDDLEISDVIELGRTIACLVKSVQDDHRLLTDQRNREISEAAKNVNREIRSSRGSKGGKLRDFYGKSHLSPTRMLQMLGGWVRGGEMEQLSRALEDGGTKRLDYMRKATGIFDEFTSKKENQEWLKKAQGKRAEWISVTVPAGITAEDGKAKIEKETFEITPMMRVGLLMHSRNVDNLRHIETGGIVIPNKEWYVKGDLSQADARGTRVKLRPEIVRAIVRDCTAQERAFAGLLEKYYDGFSKEKINETSMLLDGFERAGGEHYYGIKVSRKFLATQPEQVQKNMALDSIGSIVNERVHAGNPIILEDASTAVKDHIDLISKYYGFAIPIRDFNAVMNYTFHEAGDADGQANAYAGSVKETLQDVWGSGAQSYTDKLLADLQQQSGINETVARFLSKLRGNLAGASLMANPAVAFSQFASYPGAMQSLGPAALAAGLKPGKVDMGLIGIYSPVLWYRNQGNSTLELGDYMKQQGFAGKLPWLFGWIQKVDSFTIRRLWAASEYYVSHNTDLAPGDQKQIDAGEDPYYQEVARVFQRAVYDTQPNYTEMQRPEVLRSESDLTKAITMYKTVPLQYYNMMFEAMGRFRADSERARQNATKENIEQAKQSKTFAARTFAGILGANVTYVVMKALVKGMTGRGKKYKDDDDEYSVESVFTGLGKDLAETYAGSIIFGGELIDAFEKFKSAVTTGNYSKYGGMEISMLSAIEDTLGDLYTLAQKLSKEDYRGGLQAVKDLAKQIAVDLGFPANNIETYLLGVLRWISPEWVDRYENFFDEFERGDMKGKHGRELSAALRVLMDNRADGLSDETIDELQRLFETGFNQQLPSGVPSEITVDGEKTPLGWKERNEYREIWGQTVSSSLEKLIDSDAYQAADDEGKAKLIKKLYDYAGQIAAGQSAGKVMDAWAELGKACVAAGIPLEDYLGVAAVSKDKLKDMDGTELDDAIRARIYFRAGELAHDGLDEIARLYASGASSVVPADVPTSITVNKEEIKLSPEQRVTWMQEWKRVTSENLSALLASDAYKKVDDQARAKMIDSLYDVARAAACERVSDGYSPDKWIRVAFECTGRGIPIAESVIFHNSVSGLSKTAEKIDLLNSQDWPQDQKAYVWENTMASDTQLSKWENLKASGVKWKEAMQLIGVGEGSTSGMTESEKKTYQNEWDRISGPATKRLLANAAYKNANKATQAKYLDRLNDYVSKIAKSKAIKGFSVDKWVEQGQRLNQAGVPIDDYVVYYSDTSDAKSREKYSALNKTGWSNGQKMIAMEYISATTARTAEVGQRYQIGLSYYLDGLAKADANENGSISQDEAERYLDGTDLGREDKAYLWQMLCSSSKWKNNPYNVKMGEEIWHSLHPEG